MEREVEADLYIPGGRKRLGLGKEAPYICPGQACDDEPAQAVHTGAHCTYMHTLYYAHLHMCTPTYALGRLVMRRLPSTPVSPYRAAFTREEDEGCRSTKGGGQRVPSSLFD